MSAHIKLMEARIRLQQTKLTKSGHNKFAGYHYFELGDFLPAVQQIFSELKLCGVVSFGVDIAKLTITDMDDGSALEITSPMSTAALKGCHEVQNLGAVQTYIRRYLWVTAMEIVEHDALDASNGSEKPAKPKSNITPIAGATENVSPEALEKLKETAADIVAFATSDQWEDAFITYDNIEDNEERLAVWALLQPNSSVRSKLKKMAADRMVSAGQAY